MSVRFYLTIVIIVCCFITTVSAQKVDQPIYAMSSDGEDVRSVIVLEGYPHIGSPDISPDGKRIAVDAWRVKGGYRNSYVFIFDLETSAVKNFGPGTMPTWSADGQYIAYTKYSPHGVYIRGVDNEEALLIDEKGWGIQWSPDGQKLAYVINDKIIIYDMLEDNRRTVRPKTEEPYSYIYYNWDWSPDSQKICFKGRCRDGKYEIAIVDLSTDVPKLTVCMKVGGGYGNEFAWHPDGSRIVGIKLGKPSQLFEFKPEADVKPIPLSGQPKDRFNVGVGWSPDGKTIYFSSRGM